MEARLMYPPEAIDFDGLPAATQARIRERLGKVLGGCAAVRENREPRDPAPFEPAMVNAGAFAPGGDHRAAELASGPHIHQALSTQPEGGE